MSGIGTRVAVGVDRSALAPYGGSSAKLRKTPKAILNNSKLEALFISYHNSLSSDGCFVVGVRVQYENMSPGSSSGQTKFDAPTQKS